MAKSFDDLVSRTMSKASQRRAAKRTSSLLREMLLSELRKATGFSQKALATKLKMKQPSLSKLENAGDMQVTTLKKLVGALGGELEIVCHFPKGDVRLVQFDRTSTRRRLTPYA
jgi:transcriptional regulator with XRE-family HTH domain